MKQFPLYTIHAREDIFPSDNASLKEAKAKQAVINRCVRPIKDGSDINPPARISYGRIGVAIETFSIDGVTVEKGEEIRYNVN